MISYLLDTNAIIALIGRKSQTLVDRIFRRPPNSIALSSIVLYELYFGAHKSAKIQYNLETLRLLLVDFPVMEFDQQDAFIAGEIRAVLERNGTPIGSYDILIAGQAKARNLTLVTNNMREFCRVSDLIVEDWLD